MTIGERIERIEQLIKDYSIVTRNKMLDRTDPSGSLVNIGLALTEIELLKDDLRELSLSLDTEVRVD